MISVENSQLFWFGLSLSKWEKQKHIANKQPPQLPQTGDGATWSLWTEIKGTRVSFYLEAQWQTPAAACSLISSPSLLFLAPWAASHPPDASPTCQLSAQLETQAQPGDPEDGEQHMKKEYKRVAKGLRHESGLSASGIRSHRYSVATGTCRRTCKGAIWCREELVTAAPYLCIYQYSVLSWTKESFKLNFERKKTLQ